MSTKLSVEEFVIRAIEKLPAEGRTTIHTVFSGFNQAFREYFPDMDPIAEVKKLTADGKIAFRFARGGAVIGKPGSIATETQASSEKTLQKMGVKP